MIGRLQLDYFVISEFKLGSSFPSAQFHIGDYEIRHHSDRNKNGVDLLSLLKNE